MRRAGPRPHPLPAARAGLGVRLRAPLQRDRGLRPLPAPQDRRALRASGRSRPCAAPATGCGRTADAEPPLDPPPRHPRLRRGDGRWCSARPASSSTCASAPSSTRRSTPACARGPTTSPPLVREADSGLRRATAATWSAATESFAEVLDADGGVLDSSLAIGDTILLDPAELRRAAARARSSSTAARCPACEDESRLLAVPVDAPAAEAGRRRRHLDRGPRRVAHRPRAAAADRRAGRADARLARRLRGRRRGAAPGRGDARPRGGDLDRRARPAPAGAADAATRSRAWGRR